MISKQVSILGATGSIGDSTLALINAANDDAAQASGFEIVALTAHQNVEKLIALARAHRPQFVAIGDAAHYETLADALADLPIRVGAGASALIEAAQMRADIIIAAIVGMAGLAPCLAALEQGGVVALANKEALVAAGDLCMRTARTHATKILPADSEHNAIAQILGDNSKDLADIILTASGGPFWNTSFETMYSATPEMACAHPNWDMGAKISVDSASMMNKGLELIEAQHLFDIAPETLSILVHPQSIVHGLVRFCDGAVMAHMGVSDMKMPLAWCLAYPERMASNAQSLDLSAIGQLDFAAPDYKAFPCLELARAAMFEGGAMPIALNAANEIAVAAFLQGALRFTDIAHLVEAGLSHARKHLSQRAYHSLDDIIAIDSEIRIIARKLIGKSSMLDYKSSLYKKSKRAEQIAASAHRKVS